MRKLNNSKLKTVCAPVGVTEDVSALLAEMLETMVDGDGAGIAANQLGHDKRVIIISADGFHQEFINPVITKRYGGKVLGKEGCLSFLGKECMVVRYRQVIIEGYTKDRKPVRRKLKGFTARVAQHEVDHLNGVTFLDVATRVIG